MDILDIILRDDRYGHRQPLVPLAVPARRLDPVAHCASVLVGALPGPRLHPLFNDAARRRAGFTEEELAFLLA